MPMIRLTLPKGTDPVHQKSALENIQNAVSRILGKPLAYIQCVLVEAEAMLFAGESEPSAFIEIKSIGGLSPENCKKISSESCKVLSSLLSIPAKRIYIEFIDARPNLWGWDSTTF